MNKKTLIIISIALTIALLVAIAKAYSLFETTSTANVSSSIAKWEIKVNNTDITSLEEQNNTFNLGAISWTNQNHVRNGKGAPGATGTLQITIIPTNTEVSFLYELTFDFSSLNNSQFTVQSIAETSGETLTRTGQNTYTGVARLSDIENGKQYHITVTFIWNDVESNNENDYNLGSSQMNNINIPITFHAQQYTSNTTITEYVEPTTEESEQNETT